MNDTPPEIEKKVRELIMARSGEERLIMGALMFDAAREMILASFPAGLSEGELKKRLFERVYGISWESLELNHQQPGNSQVKL
jgi:hypothetical protein